MSNCVVSFDMDRCHVELNYPYALTHLPIRNLKKLFDIMCRQHWRNTEAIKQTDESLLSCIEEAQAEAVRAEISYRDGYVSTQFNFDLTATDKKRIERKNKQLYNKVLNRKKAYDRMRKIYNYFIDTKSKYKIKNMEA